MNNLSSYCGLVDTRISAFDKYLPPVKTLLKKNNYVILFYFHQVERLEIKDVILPQNLQRAMAAEAEATREARAKVIQADGELKSSKSLKEASDVISESPAALTLRFLQTLSHISAEKNSTIIFPLPIELMKTFMGKAEVSNDKKTN